MFITSAYATITYYDIHACVERTHLMLDLRRVAALLSITMFLSLLFDNYFFVEISSFSDMRLA